MKSIQESLIQFQGKLSNLGSTPVVAVMQQRASRFQRRIISLALPNKIQKFTDEIMTGIARIKAIGVEEAMEDYDKRKLGIFNLLNFFQSIFAVLAPMIGLVNNSKLPPMAYFIASMPAIISLIALRLNAIRKYEASQLTYFTLYPVVTSIIYLSGMNLGIELFFILYGVLAVFFIQDIGHMLFSIALSMISYFILTVVWRNYQFQLEVNGAFYLSNHLLAIIFIFYALFLIKKENNGYHLGILYKNKILHDKNEEIESQKREIAEKADQLKSQATELAELNVFKTKLFSIISHDLKTPMYALRNMFRNVEQYDLPADEIKALVPDVVHDLNYTTSLMENLLQWAKCQMQAHAIIPQKIDVSELASEMLELVRLQAYAKNQQLKYNIKDQLFIYADIDMIKLVLRNLLSNAIKFTPENGIVSLYAQTKDDMIEISVSDTGLGISQSAMEKISQNDYYTTKGTASESGTGLGLMLCKEFVMRNNGQLRIQSSPGKGSTFSFAVPAFKI